MRTLIIRQLDKSRTDLAVLAQGELFKKLEGVSHQAERRQLEHDITLSKTRAETLQRELDTEPAAVAALYDVRMTRLSPVGLVVSWPEALV